MSGARLSLPHGGCSAWFGAVKWSSLFLTIALTACDASTGSDGAASGHASPDIVVSMATEEDNQRSELKVEIEVAKAEFEEKSEELSAAVQDLDHNRWAEQMTEIRHRLQEADDSLTALEGLKPGDPAVMAARDHLDTMAGHMDRLKIENWRHVAPDLSESSSEFEDAAEAVSAEPAEE
ncbi:hypothetical protein [Piscinibacter koreensis]|uniref:Uncharacterized protein n=1 Tax=Piscinibacter koreensis TaxID=2742824 RepID=A0A7Y6NP18_9BURK|nr:hypothetical protein [Schlegelella koreensis]NUZ06732.1 hypothetical protein [Schlegelella koreensis]